MLLKILHKNPLEERYIGWVNMFGPGYWDVLNKNNLKDINLYLYL